MNVQPQRLMTERISTENFDLIKHTRANVTKRRDRHEIVAEILETARGGVLKTHIMFKARISGAQLNNYLALLVEKGLLENPAIEGNRKTTSIWKTSEKGIRYLENFRLLEV